MHHGISLISTFAAAFGLALIFGWVAVRLKLPALVGYLVAGIILGPATPGFVADVELSHQLADIGVMLLMFGVGLRFSLGELWGVRHIAIPGALVRIVVAAGLGVLAARLWGWSLGAGFVFGLALSVSSTVVLLRTLEDRGLMESVNGRIAVGWAVVEDLVTVLLLVLLPPLAGWMGGQTAAPPVAEGRTLLATLAITLGQVAVFVGLMYVAGRRVLPWFLWQVARTGSRELFTLCVIAVAVGIAYAASVLFGVSFALGAFVAGTVMRESALSHRAAAESMPLRDAFSVLFFVSVGMLFDPHIVVRAPVHLLVVVAIVVFGRSIAAFLTVLTFRYPLNTALTVSASLAQIGEFSFILASLGVSLKILPPQGESLILAGSLLSIALNPLLLRAVDPLQAWIRVRSQVARALERPDDPLAELPASVDQTLLTGHVVIVGYGRVGSRIARALRDHGIPIVVAEQSRELVERLREDGIPSVSGDASVPAVLIQAHVARAWMLVIASPDAFRSRRMIEIARALKPDVEVVVRTHSDDEAALVRKEHGARVFLGEEELATTMARHVLERVDVAGAGEGGLP